MTTSSRSLYCCCPSVLKTRTRSTARTSTVLPSLCALEVSATEHSCLCLPAPRGWSVRAASERARESCECNVISNAAAHEKQENVRSFNQEEDYIQSLMKVWVCWSSEEEGSKAEKSFHGTSPCICEQRYIFFFKLDTLCHSSGKAANMCKGRKLQRLT